MIMNRQYEFTILYVIQIAKMGLISIDGNVKLEVVKGKPAMFLSDTSIIVNNNLHQHPIHQQCHLYQLTPKATLKPLFTSRARNVTHNFSPIYGTLMQIA